MIKFSTGWGDTNNNGKVKIDDKHCSNAQKNMISIIKVKIYDKHYSNPQKKLLCYKGKDQLLALAGKQYTVTVYYVVFIISVATSFLPKLPKLWLFYKQCSSQQFRSLLKVGDMP